MRRMNSSAKSICSRVNDMKVPANIILGYLGTGKTTTIRHLLATKPKDQRWGVIVNEFGDVGIDGEIMGAGSEKSRVIEVPGGCVCCSATLPSRQALEKFVESQQLDRILIEPTGLAHPRNVVSVFRGTGFSDILDLQATITLVDPWYFEHADYAKLENYELQMALADVLVANKCDKATPAAITAFLQYSDAFQPKKSRVEMIEFGSLDWRVLEAPSTVRLSEVEPVEHALRMEKRSFSREGIERKESSFEGGHTCGWLFESCFVFEEARIAELLRTVPADRVKGIVQTEKGWYFVNRMNDDWQWQATPDKASEIWAQSRVEMLHAAQLEWQEIENKLCGTLVV